MDVPLVADYVASILSALYLVSAIDDLSFSLHLPEENNYSYSSNQYSLIVKVRALPIICRLTLVQTATFIQRASDEATAKKFFTASLEGRNVSELDDMNREQVERAIEKNQAAYLVRQPLLHSLTSSLGLTLDPSPLLHDETLSSMSLVYSILFPLLLKHHVII